MALSPEQQAQADELKRSQPGWSDDDVQAWGRRYYGWGGTGSAAGSPSSPSGSAAGGSGGSTGVLPISAPSPVTAPTSSLSVSAPSPASGIDSPTVGGGMFDFTLPPQESTTVGTGTGSGVTTGPSGTAAPPVGTTPAPRTVTVNGQTFTIPSAPTLNTTPTTGAAPTANTPTLNYAPEDPMLGVVREQLIAMMARANGTPSLNDPTIKPAADTYTAAQERARRGLQADTAESLSARGLGSSGAADAAQRQSYETMGQNIGTFNAKLLSDEQTARRGDLKSALEMANELGMFKEKSALERDLATLDVQTKTNLANLDAQLKTAGLTVQERLGIMDAELKKYGIDLEGNMGLLNTVLENEFNYAQLKVQTDLANLDATVKTNIANLDAQMRQQGFSTQERLAAIDAEVRKYGIDVQGNLGLLDVALRKQLGIGQLNLGLLNALLSNQQYNDGLGWDMAKTIIGQNANAVTGG